VPESLASRNSRNLSPCQPTNSTGSFFRALFANPAAVGLDADNIEDIIHGMVHRLTRPQQPLPILRREDHAVTRELLAEQVDLEPEELELGISPSRPGLREQSKDHLNPSRQHRSTLHLVARKSSIDRSPTFWTAAAAMQGEAVLLSRES